MTGREYYFALKLLIHNFFAITGRDWLAFLIVLSNLFIFLVRGMSECI